MLLGPEDGHASASPLRQRRQQAEAILTPRGQALLAALKSHLVVCLGDVSLTANQSVRCMCQVGGVYLLSAQLPGLIVLSLVLPL